jgi:hypothetical protein
MQPLKEESSVWLQRSNWSQRAGQRNERHEGSRPTTCGLAVPLFAPGILLQSWQVANRAPTDG